MEVLILLSCLYYLFLPGCKMYTINSIYCLQYNIIFIFVL